MEKILKDYGRFLLLQAQLPGLEKEKERTRREALAADRERSQRKVEWQFLEDPGFFQRLLGKVEEKREKAHGAFREADAAWKNACHASQLAEQAYAQVKTELDGLSDAPEAYGTLPKTEAVREKAADALRPAALYDLSVLLPALESALQWENRERETNGRLLSQEDGMLERLAEAREPAKHLKYILEQFPDPDSWMCGYLLSPDGFIHDGVIMKISPRDKIRIAIAQMQKLKTRLQ